MHDGTGARANLQRLDPLVFREVGLHLEVLIWNLARCRHGVFLFHGDDDVGLADLPALRIFGLLRQVSLIAFRRAGVDPA
jgi:hypothetical protein